MSKLYRNAKQFLGDAIIPVRYHVPFRYYINRWRGLLEQELDLLDAVVKRDDLVVDVGANRGIYVYKLWHLGARIEAFEPNPSCFHLLNGWAKGKYSISLHRVALSDHAGRATLHIPIDREGVEHDASASISPVVAEGVREQNVSMDTLDSFQFTNVAFIKIDVEGHEDKVISGASQTIRNSRPAILVEIEQRHSGIPVDDMFRRITSQSYSGFFLLNGKLESLTNFNTRVHQDSSGASTKRNQYINNFLFLDKKKLESGAYKALRRFGL
ncbi:FkbM family methyltransferase [Mesorhizobium sp. M0959]|uniref:FkbM family methyltransferase n=1 Tax=unclassified Mesorhizobium TaxID=325217 RepID=UPI00333D0EB8